MNEIQYVSWKWAALLLLAGGILFWIGAFTPPYKQWTTNDSKEYLSIIHSNKIGWYIIHGFFLAGIIATVFGIQLLSNLLISDISGKIFSTIASAAYMLGAVFWILNIAFRLTVTFWAADTLSQTNSMESSFQTWMDWSNIIFAIYMVLAYLAIGCLGIVLKEVAWIPSWTSWLMILFGFIGIAGYSVRFVLFEPPLMIHLPLIILGIAVIIRLPHIS